MVYYDHGCGCLKDLLNLFKPIKPILKDLGHLSFLKCLCILMIEKDNKKVEIVFIYIKWVKNEVY